MFLRYNEGKSVVAERLIRTLKNKTYKHMTAISENVYFNVLDDIVDEYNNKCHKTVKMKPVDVKSDSFAECNEISFNKESNEKDPKFKVGDHVRIPKFKNVFAKVYTPNGSEEIFVVKKIKNTVPWTYIRDLNGEEIFEKELQKNNQKEFKIEKAIKRKGNKLYVKWKGYNNFLVAGFIKRIL